jgi:hypothetical protein
MYLSVKSLKPLDGYKLLLKFENNEEKVFESRGSFNVKQKDR